MKKLFKSLFYSQSEKNKEAIKRQHVQTEELAVHIGKEMRKLKLRIETLEKNYEKNMGI